MHAVSAVAVPQAGDAVRGVRGGPAGGGCGDGVVPCRRAPEEPGAGAARQGRHAWRRPRGQLRRAFCHQRDEVPVLDDQC